MTGESTEGKGTASTDAVGTTDSTDAIRAHGKSGRLGGARADFVASLGRKVADARVVLSGVERDPAARAPRDDLRRKLHALGAGSRLLRFEALANALSEAESTLERAGTAGRATAADVEALAKLLDDLPALAWADPASRMGSASEPPRAARHTALVIGDEDLAAALAELPEESAQFDCERTDDEQLAFELARSILPDVIVLDGDKAAGAELVEALLDDPVTEPIPIVVLVAPASEHAGRYVALGVTRVLSKPVAPSAVVQACTEIAEQRSGAPPRVTLGSLSLEELSERLGNDLRRALLEGVDAASLKRSVAFGDGAEIYGAMWGAIARIREIVATRSDGAVRMTATGPEGALTLAPWLHAEVPAAERSRGRGAAVDVQLEGRKVIVADDDPGVTWFISDLLRTNGCIVHEALDGQTALDMAFRIAPDLVVSDILMPGLDGFALSRALKRDVALRDVPIILLSWKEDLLQRVRELGVSASAYLRKESDARAVIARVREALWAKSRVEQRLRGGAEVRGRLDGITVRSLLEIVCQQRPRSRVSIRDACFLYEVDIHDGTPRRVTRTGGDGSFERGERVIASMLGASAGWFVVAPHEGPATGELQGTLASLLAKPVATARGAAHALAGARTIFVDRVQLDLTMMEGYLRVTPAPARLLIERIAAGESPRELLLAGEIDPWLLEDVLVDLAVRGVVKGVRGVEGEDLLGPSVEAAHAALQGLPRRSLAPKAPSMAPPRASVRPEPRRPVVDADDELPPSLADAVMRELREPGDPAVLHRKEPATELDTVYEARVVTPSSPTADVLRAKLEEESRSLPLPLIKRSEPPGGAGNAS